MYFPTARNMERLVYAVAEVVAELAAAPAWHVNYYFRPQMRRANYIGILM